MVGNRQWRTDTSYAAARALIADKLALAGNTDHHWRWIIRQGGVQNANTAEWTVPIPGNNRDTAALLHGIVSRRMQWAAVNPKQKPAAPDPQAATGIRRSIEACADIPAAGTDDLIAALRLVTPARRKLDDLEHDAILAARDRGLSWKQIAEALGLGSPQTVQHRFRRLAERRSALRQHDVPRISP